MESPESPQGASKRTWALRLPEPLAQEIERRAEADGRSAHAWVLRAIEAAIEGPEEGLNATQRAEVERIVRRLVRRLVPFGLGPIGHIHEPLRNPPGPGRPPLPPSHGDDSYACPYDVMVEVYSDDHDLIDGPWEVSP